MWRGRIMLALLLGVAPVLALAQPPAPYNERDVKHQQNVQDRDDIWVLDFRFKDPRLITVDIPGRGKKVVWYLWYQVINDETRGKGEPRTFIPDFELVTQDKPGVYHDQVLPRVQEAIRRLEDPTGYLDIKNSVTITQQPIPVSKQEAVPRAVTGVATWDDVDPDSNRFSIFVAGLSNGWSLDDRGVVRRKVLQLNFKRLGDRFFMDSREIRFAPPTEWLYRASTITVPGVKPIPEEAPKEKEKEKDKEAARR